MGLTTSSGAGPLARIKSSSDAATSSAVSAMATSCANSGAQGITPLALAQGCHTAGGRRAGCRRRGRLTPCADLRASARPVRGTWASTGIVCGPAATERRSNTVSRACCMEHSGTRGNARESAVFVGRVLQHISGMRTAPGDARSAQFHWT